MKLVESTEDLSLVLMDVMMPEMDGYETMRRIRAQPEFRTVADHRTHGKGNEGRPREMSGGRSLRLRRETCEYRAAAVSGAVVAPSVNSASVGTAARQAGQSRKVDILLVDDQAARLLTYESILRDLNHNLVAAHSGAEALEKLMRQEFAVVLLDVSMPDMDGFEAARLIHEHPRFERTPIIFVTGVHMSEFDRLEGYKVGAVDYVSVPVVPGDPAQQGRGAGRAVLQAPRAE